MGPATKKTKHPVFRQGPGRPPEKLLVPGYPYRVRASSKTILGDLLHFGASLRGNGSVREFAGDLSPLRSELFSADQMELHGKALAQSHQVATARAQDSLLSRLAENEAVLTDAVDLLTAAIKADQQISPAGEWLLDNFYLIEEQIRTAKRHLPRNYSRELPRLLNGPSAGFRAFTILRSRRSRTATGASIRKVSAGSWRLTRRSPASTWANCGRFPSCCAWR